LGSSKKEIMALSKDLAVGQPADVAMEATRLAGEACDAIKASRESIRAALRELGAASDISEASGPTRARPQQQERPAMGRLDSAGQQPAASTWPQRPPPLGVGGGNPASGLRVVSTPPSPPRATMGNAEPRWPPMHTLAVSAWPPAESLPRPRMREEDGELSTLMRGM
jgi:hypothetical protein